MITQLARKAAGRLAAVSLSSAVILLSPGLGAYQALALNVTASRSSRPTAAVVRPASSSHSRPFVSTPALRVPGMTASPLTVRTKVSSAQPAGSSSPLSPSESARLSIQVADTLRSAGDISAAAPGQAYGTGETLTRILTGERRASPAMDGAVPSAQALGSLSGSSAKLSKRTADSTRGPSFPAPPNDGSQGPGRGPGESGGPLWHKLLASGTAAAALTMLVKPMLANFPLFGWVYAAAALAVSLTPLVPAEGRLPGFIRRLPGTLLSIAGTAALGLGLGESLTVALLAAVSGSGLSKMIDGHKGAETMSDPLYRLGFAGAVAAAMGLGASVLGMTGPLATALTAAAYLTSPILLARLGIWESVWATVSGVGRSMEAIDAVLGFSTRETSFDDNLRGYYRYQLQRSAWNAGWLWLPWTLGRLARLGEVALSLSFGLVIGTLRAPSLYLERASREKDAASRWTAFWNGFNASWIGSMEGSKALYFDRAVKVLIPMMDAKDPVTSRPSAGAFVAFGLARLVQFGWLGWLASTIAITPLMAIRCVFYGISAAKGIPQDPPIR